MPSFDREAAKAAGYTDAEIDSFLSGSASSRVQAAPDTTLAVSEAGPQPQMYPEVEDSRPADFGQLAGRVGAGALRTLGPWATGAAGGILGGPLGIPLGAAAGSAASERGAQGIEQMAGLRSEIDPEAVDRAGMFGGVMGAVPGAASGIPGAARFAGGVASFPMIRHALGAGMTRKIAGDVPAFLKRMEPVKQFLGQRLGGKAAQEATEQAGSAAARAAGSKEAASEAGRSLARLRWEKAAKVVKGGKAKPKTGSAESRVTKPAGSPPKPKHDVQYYSKSKNQQINIEDMNQKHIEQAYRKLAATNPKPNSVARAQMDALLEEAKHRLQTTGIHVGQ